MEADFSGWATKSGLKCTDGRTIAPGAFRHQDKARVPLVWQHGHSDPENVLGHALLEDRGAEGTYAYCFFNKTGKAAHAKQLVEHGDINMLSIWANRLIERAAQVLHGSIREVSLVLAGANPGALIENVTIRHGEDIDLVEDEAIIYTGLSFEHADDSGSSDDSNSDQGSQKSVEDIYNSMTDEQKDVLHYMVATAVADADDSGDGNGDSAQHGNLNDDGNDTDKEGSTVNVFDQNDGSEGSKSKHVLSHSEVESIFADAQKRGSLKDAVEAYMESASGLAHGINDIDELFPEAKALTAAPEFYKRRTEWVNVLLSGVSKSPFSRVKTHWADLHFDEARAKGYIKGTLKKEEFFGTARRVTTPATIYKKQKLDRDDIIDITDFDVVAWMKGEMRLMLEEEVARAILLGDGRQVDDEDKISETNIRPILSDDEMFTVTVNVNLDDSSSSMTEVIDALTLNRQYLRGTGLPVMFTTETVIARMLLLKDTLGRRLYSSLAELETVLRVSSIVPVEVMDGYPDIVCILVNLSDYTVGADKGGQTTMFDDFDIDYNQYKYLIETRMSGALTKLKSAMVVRETAAANVLALPQEPAFNEETGVITIPTVTGVVYKDTTAAGATIPPGAMAPLADGASKTVVAVPAAGYYFATTENDTWTFTYHADA